MRKLLLALSAVALVGCSSAGPFVTRVTPDGKGGLVVERAVLRFNPILGGHVSVGDRTSEIIRP